MAEIVAQCRQQRWPDAYVELLWATTPLARKCPYCGNRCKTRDYDEYDVLAEKYGIDRLFFSTADRMYRPTSLIAFMTREDFGLKPQPTNGYLALTCHCYDCHSRFRIRHLNQTTDKGASFCIYCGSNNVGVVQDHDADYWEILGSAYGLPPDLTQSIYELWETTPTKTFAQFIESMRKELVG